MVNVESFTEMHSMNPDRHSGTPYSRARSTKTRIETERVFFDSKITNGILEGINSIVQLQKRNARGFKNVQYFVNVIYLKLGKLKFELPT
jgi:transposase